MPSDDSSTDRTGNDRSSRITRRTALASIAAAGVVGTGVVTAAGRGQAEVLRRGTRGDPVDPGAIVDVQKDSFRRVGRRGASVEPVVVEPERDDGREVVAYAHYVDDRGVMHSYVGSVLSDVDDVTRDGQRTDVADRHRAAQAFLDGSDRATRQSGGFTTENMSEVRDVTDDIEECPHGKVLTTYKVFEGDDDPSMFAMGGTYRVLPGNNECDSVWLNDTLSIEHSWYDDDYDVTVRDHDPSGSHSGSTSTSFEIGTGGVSLGWSHSTPDISRNDTSTSTTFEQTFSWNDDHGESNVFRGGSIADREKSWGCREQLGAGRQEMTFTDGFSTETFDSGYGFYEYCSCC